jgi:hypothetical protein
MIVPSFLLFIGALSSNIYFIYLEGTLRTTIFNATKLAPVGTGFWGISMVGNVITTGE